MKIRFIILLILAIGNSPITLSNSVVIYGQQAEINTKLVHAGQGNATEIVFAFIPKNMVIKTGESITWDNPNIYAEAHSVTFLNEAKYFPEFIVPFNVTDSTEFRSSDPNTDADPLIGATEPSEKTKTVIMINARAYVPVVIDSSGSNVTYLQPNSHYTMEGKERLVNSGWLWPEGQTPPGIPPITNFTITFQEPGTYSYLCNLHPWMSGSVVVK
jgi:plastocyanin